MSWPKPITLSNQHYTLALLSHDHHDGLIEASIDGELWKILYALVPSPNEMHNEITRRLELQQKGSMLPFAVIDNSTQRPIGMTSYCWTDEKNRRLDIGWTWYAKSHQRTALNTACKFMLLKHAFETLDCIAVGFRVDTLNHPSQSAVERIGAKLEGVMRNYSILPGGKTRDMCFYSIIDSEWSRIKLHLTKLMKQRRS